MIDDRSTLADVVSDVSQCLARHGIRAVLTGGACASLHSDGAYMSHDLDFIAEGLPRQNTLDAALASLGYRRDGAQYVHPHSPFFVEFPRGPLAIGDDDLVKASMIRIGAVRVPALSATDSCRDRLAAFYWWSDRQSLAAAVAIARRRRVNMTAIKEWSRRENRLAQFEEFRRAVRRRR